MKGGLALIKVLVNLAGNWTPLKGNDTIDGINYNVASPELFPTPKFVEIIHNNEKYYVNSVFIQYVPESPISKIQFSDKRII